MPSKYLEFGFDFSGDGQVDLWRDKGDVFASTANYLRSSGWQADRPWGIEVSLPPGFDYALADGEFRQPAAAWGKLGVRPVVTDPSPARRLPEGDIPYALLIPAGYRGPAFMISENYNVIMKYNFSTSYALGVALLGDRLAGRPGVQAAWPIHERPLSREEREDVQRGLERQGYPVGALDGVIGRQTRAAVRQFQKSHGLPADGFVSQSLLAYLR
jgi:membrane-bound lytic murein transglycosylase B